MSDQQPPEPTRPWWADLPRDGATAKAWERVPEMSKSKEARQHTPVVVGELQTRRKGSR